MTESEITNFVNCTLVQAPKLLSIFSASITSVFIPVITAGNFLVILSVFKDPHKELRTAFNFFVVNLAIADLVVGMLTCPLALVTHIIEAEGTLPSEMKRLRQSLHYSYFASVSASLLNLAALCIDRVIAIRSPLRYRIELSFWHHVISAVGIWVIAVSVSCVYFEIGYEQMAMIMAIVSILFTFIVMISTILVLYCAVKKRDRNMSYDGGRNEIAVIPLERINSRHRLQSEGTISRMEELPEENGTGRVNSLQGDDNLRRLSIVSTTTEVPQTSDLEDDVFDIEETVSHVEHRRVQISYSFGTHLSIESAHQKKKVRLKRVRSLGSLEVVDDGQRNEGYDSGSCVPQERVEDERRSDLQGGFSVEADAAEMAKCRLGDLCVACDIKNYGGLENETFVDDDSILQITSVNQSVSSEIVEDINDEVDCLEEDCLPDDVISSVENDFEQDPQQQDNSTQLREECVEKSSNCISLCADDLTAQDIARAVPSTLTQAMDIASNPEILLSKERSSPNKSETSSYSIKMHTPNNPPNRKLEMMLLIMLSAFLICFVPSCSMIFYLNSSGGSCELRHWMRDVTFLLAVTNSAMNPFIYAWRLPAFRKAIGSLLCSKLQNQVQPHARTGTTTF